MDELKINIPDGMEVDKEKSDLKTGDIYFKKKENKIRTWNELVCNSQARNIKIDFSETRYISGNDGSIITPIKEQKDLEFSDRNLFSNEKYARRALAASQISMLIKYGDYGGEVTQEEWDDINTVRYFFTKISERPKITNTHCNLFQILAFHEKEQARSFLENNEQLVKDFLMIE